MEVELVSNGVSGWLTWWRGLPLWRRLAPLGFILAYWGALWSIDGVRTDHLQFGVVIFILGYGGRLAERILRFILPLLLVAVIYDSQRFWSDYVRGRIRIAEPYNFDLRFFGIKTPEGVLTPNEWWQKHLHPVFDLLAGFAYMVFIGVFVLSAAYFQLWLPKRGTRLRSPEWLRARTPAVMWSFFWVNMLGYSTYYWYPAAPPWYVALHGFGPAKLDTLPNPAGTLRFDALLGINYFSAFYGRSADVFGAVPSLHVAYPFIAAYFAFRFGALRVSTSGFYLLMCFSAVYLNHHYVLDVLWGTLYAILVVILVEQWMEQRIRKRSESEPVRPSA